MSGGLVRPWSLWLRRYRDDRDLTQEELGEVLDVDGKMVSAWENGQRPGRRHARTICSRLGTTRAELGLAGAGDGPLVGRRDFLRLSAGVGSLALFGPWAGVDRPDGPGVEGFQVATEALGRLWMRVGPAAALGPALGHVESVTRLLQGSLPAAARAPLCGVLAEGAALVAICKGAMGDAEGADHFAAVAAAAARETADADLAAYVLLSAAAADARLDASGRLASYVGGAAAATPATRAWAAALAAEVHAGQGRAEASLAALDDASRRLAAGPARRPPWPDEHWLAGERGVSLALLGRPAEARTALAAALGGTGAERTVDRLRWSLAMARAHLHEGNREAAARLASEVLAASRRQRHAVIEAAAAALAPGISHLAE